jgi:ABC-type multidrug transport system ATPase subunit
MTDPTAPDTVSRERLQEAAADRADRDPAVRLDGLGHAFGSVEVLADLSLTIDRGDVACLVGPNGSGKTTLLRLIAGLLEPDRGTVTVDADGPRPVGYLPQRPAFRAGFTVRETLSFYASLVGAEATVDDLLDLVGLTAVADRDVAALSGGMTRLLGIAQTVVGDPPLLVLDEPASGLDPTMTRHVADAIADVGERGDTVVLATHNLAAVERIADAVVVLDRGEVVAAAPPASLLSETETATLADAFAALTESDIPTVYAGRQEGDQ